MNNTQVIEIASSPESSPKPAARPLPRRRKGKQRTPFIPTDDIIELTDSDKDIQPSAPKNVPAPRRKPKERVAEKAAPAAGPSRVKPAEERLPLFLSDSENELPLEPAKQVVKEQPPPVPVVLEPAADDAFIPVPPSEPGSLLQAVAPNPNPFDGYVAQVLEIIPDVLPEHVRSLIEQRHPTYNEQVVENVLHTLFEDPTYPKRDPKGKGKRKREELNDDTEGAMQSAKQKVDYASKDRKQEGGLNYATQALVGAHTVPLISAKLVSRG